MRHIKQIFFFSLLMLTLSCTKDDSETQNCTGVVVETMGGYQAAKFAFDNDGYVWMLCKDSPYIFKTDGDNIIRYGHDNDDPGSLSSNKINDILSDRDGVIWIATQKGVDVYDSDRNCFEHLTLDNENSYVISIDRSSSGKTCIATRRGIFEFDEEQKVFLSKYETSYINPASEPKIFFDNENKLWVYYEDKLDCFDAHYDVIHSETLDSTGADVVFDEVSSLWFNDGNEVYILDTQALTRHRAEDVYPELSPIKQGRVAYAGHGTIVLTYGTTSMCVNTQRREVVSRDIASRTIRAVSRYASEGGSVMAIDSNDNLWATSAIGGFKFYPSSSGERTNYDSLLLLLEDRKIDSYVQDNEYFWFLDESTLSCYNFYTKSIVSSIDLSGQFYRNNPFKLSLNKNGDVFVSGAPRRFSDGLIVSISNGKQISTRHLLAEAQEGISALGNGSDIVFAGTGSKIYTFSQDSPAICRETDNIFNDNACYASMVQTLNDRSVLICFTDHLPVIYNSAKDEVRILQTEGISQVYFSTCSQDPYGNIWIGSTDNGLFMCPNGTDALVHVDAFPDIHVRDMASDGDGNVFVMDFDGNVYLFNNSYSLQRKVWTDSSDYPQSRYLITLPDRSVALVGASSYISFSKEKLKSSPVVGDAAHIVITSGNKIISSFCTEEYPSRIAKLHFPRNTKDLNLHIGLIDGKDPHSNYSYEYSINGFKTRESFSNSFIPLYGVDRSHNTVRFSIHNNNFDSSTEPFTIKVKMNLLWYEIVIPVFIIILMICSAVMIFVFLRKRREANEERVKREMTEQVNIDNIDFFANISHEFRTPLTLIHGAVSILDTDGDKESAKSVAVIKRNTDRLLKLVSQMLDFNKLDHGVLKLNVKMEPISDIIEETKTNFDIGAGIKSIQLLLKMPEDRIIGWADRDKMEKILYNLCSNAIKYTSPGGTITIEAKVDSDDQLTVSVSDTGIGISADDLDKVFDRFYQTETTKKAGGTGIGLYYTKALVNLHHGKIKATQNKDQDGNVTGSTFTFTIPVGKQSYSESEMNGAEDKRVSLDHKEYLSEYVKEESTVTVSGDKAKLMIIDDDYEVVYYLKSIFSETYNVYFRFDAMSGYKMIEEVHPDIIISDVMMLDVDGVELCRMVKNNLSLSHIPVIMLTAKSTMEDQIQSLGAGADAYVVKPFNPDYLMALVKSTIENRNRVRRMLNSSTTVTSDSSVTLSNQDRAFMEQMYKAMQESLQSGELDIDSIAAQMRVSRTKFYYKVKALTGQTPNDFFTTYKLNYSLDYLKERKYKISAISEMLGFSSASHFSALFKKKFGVLPSQYAENETNV